MSGGRHEEQMGRKTEPENLVLRKWTRPFYKHYVTSIDTSLSLQELLHKHT